MRCFIAIDIDESVRENICQLQESLGKQVDLKRSEAKWVEPENVHLTLKFLGEVRDQEITGVCRIVEETAAEHGRFSVDIEGVGTFGRPARVVWAGVGRQADLKALHKDLDGRMARAGWPGEGKEFTAHLTLCRVKSARAGKVLQDLVERHAAEHLGTVSVDSVCVYKSDLTSKGPVYTLISRSMLK